MSMFIQDISLLFPFLVMSLSGFDINVKDGMIWKVFFPLIFYEKKGMNLNGLVNTFKVAAKLASLFLGSFRSSQHLHSFQISQGCVETLSWPSMMLTLLGLHCEISG